MFRIIILIHLIIQCFIIYKTPDLWNDESLPVLYSRVYNFKAQLIPGLIKFIYGGQAGYNFLLKIYIILLPAFKVYLLRLFSLAFSIGGINYLYKYLKKIEFKYINTVLLLLILNPYFIYYSTELKHYIFDFFCIAIILFYDSKKSSALLSTLIIYFSIPAATVMFAKNIINHIARKDYQYSILLLLQIVTSIFYVKVLLHNFPNYFYESEILYWKKYFPHSLYKFTDENIFIYFFKSFMSSINNFFYYLPIKLFFFTGLFALYKLNKKMSLLFILVMFGTAFSATLSLYPIVQREAASVMEYRTSFYLILFCSVIYSANIYYTQKLKPQFQLIAGCILFLIVSMTFIATKKDFIKRTIDFKTTSIDIYRDNLNLHFKD